MIRWALFAFICFLSCVNVAVSDDASKRELAEQIREFDGRVILRGTLRRNPMTAMLSRYVAAELRRANQKDRATWQAIKTKSDWETMRDRRIKALRDSLGTFPAVPEDLKVQVVRTTKGDGFEVDNLIFESRPGVVVTANLYRPAKATSSMPGIMVCHSHHRPKETTARQLMGATWARAGCVVLVPDHLGHGERRQHPFRSESDYDKPFRVSSQDYYFRYDAAIQTYLIDDSLMGWFVWDLQRGVDVLLEQPGVDPQRIMMSSEPAGGCAVGAVAASLDDRITGVMVNNFGGPEPENGYPLPPDDESWFSYTSSGSWESTRNLRLSARDGFLPWTIVASVAPRRLIYYHEFYWDRQQDPVWKRFQKIYGFYDAADSLTGLAGHGFVVGSSPENTHWTPYSREVLYPTLENWFDIKNPKMEYGRLIHDEQLLCLTTAEGKQIQPVPLHRLCSQIGKERADAARATLNKMLATDCRSHLRAHWSTLMGDVTVNRAPIVRKREQDQIADVRVERIQLGTEPGIIVPVLLLVPKTERPQRVVVAVAQSGKQAFLRHRSEQVAELLEAETAVCLLDVRGTGETAPGDDRGRRSASTTIASSELMLGQTLVGARLRDVRQVIRYLRDRDDLNSKRIALWGDSFAPTNSADCNFVVPRGITDRPHQSEPLGSLLALLTALFDEEVEAVYINGGLSSFQDVLASPFCYLPHDSVVPGVLASGDLCDVAAAIAPRPLRLNGLVDGLNRRQPVDGMLKEYATAANSYRRAGAEHHFSIGDNELSIAAWLLANNALGTNSNPDIGPIGDIERIHDGFRFTEGPADDGQGNLYFSDIPANRVFKVDRHGKLSIFLEDSGGINGMMFDTEGTLYACQGGKGRVLSIDTKTKEMTVLADKVGDQPLGKPNDLVLDRHGGVYFSDPGRGAVYYRNNNGVVTQFSDGIKRPNGVILSPDEKTLFVIPSGQPQMMAYSVTAPGKLKGPRIFCTIEELKGQKNTGGDGATVDTDGNLYIATRAGVQVFDAHGKPLKVIRFSGFDYPKHPANVTFGGGQRRTLFITARDALFRAKMNATGHVFPGRTP